MAERSSAADLRRSRSPSLERIDRPPSLYRPPIRSLASPRLSSEEVDELTNPNLPYRTGYTYAFSKSYRTLPDDEYEIPNMGSSSLYYFESDSAYDGVSSSSSSIVYRVYEEVVTVWYKLVTAVYCSLASTYAGGRSLLEWIYYILYSVSYAAWCAVYVGGRSIFELVYLVLYSIVYGVWYALDGVGRNAYSLGGAVGDTLLLPFRGIAYLVSAPPKKVSYSDDDQVRYFNQDDSVSVSSKDSDSDEREESRSSFFFFSPFAFFRRKRRTHMEPIYELRSRTVEKEVMDSEPDTDQEGETFAVHRSLYQYDETPPAPPVAMTARLPLKRAARRVRRVTYAETNAEYIERIVSVLFFPFYLVYRGVIALFSFLYNAVSAFAKAVVDGTTASSVGLLNLLLAIFDVLLVRPATAVAKWISSPTTRRRSEKSTVHYIHEEEDPVYLRSVGALHAYQEDNDENVEPLITRRVVHSTEAFDDDDDDLAPLPAVARARRSVSRRLSNSSAHSGGGDTHVVTTTTTTTIRRRRGEFTNGKLGSNGTSWSESTYKESPSVLSGAKNVVDTLLFAPFRSAGYLLQNSVNYVISPIHNMFASDASGYKRKRTSTSSASSYARSDTTYVAPGGVLWAVRDSATTAVTKAYDVVVFLFYFIYELIRAVWELTTGTVYTLFSTFFGVLAGLWNGITRGTASGASAAGGAAWKASRATGAVAEESWEVIRTTGSSLGGGAAALWRSRPSACSLLKLILLLIPLILFFFWLYAIPPFDKENETVNAYIKHAHSIAEDYYAYGSKRSRSFLTAAWENLYFSLASVVDFVRMLLQALVMGIYGIYAFFMDSLSTLKMDKWIANRGAPPVIIEEHQQSCDRATVPPPVVLPPSPPPPAPPAVECPPPAPPVIVHTGPTAEEQEALVAAIIAKVTAQMEKRMEESLSGRMHIIEETVHKAEAELRSKLTIEHEPIDYTALDAMIAAAIRKYDSDKTGLVDYALESSGGQIISTRCSETYPLATRLEKIFNIPLYYSNFGPRVVIQRNSQGLVPGECWAFKGGIGYLTIKLAHPINVTSVSYEHIPRSLSPSGENLSAPKKFSIFSYENDEYNFDSRTLLGQFEYDNQGEPLQFFKIDVVPSYPVQIIEFQVDSNHGQDKYTCLYRFRVHGDLAKKL